MEINLKHKQKQKNILTDDENYQGTQHIKRVFGIRLCWYLILKKIGLQKP